jgi:hypothetical protein
VEPLREMQFSAMMDCKLIPGNRMMANQAALYANKRKIRHPILFSLSYCCDTTVAR